MSVQEPHRVLIASQNEGKVREFRRLLGSIPADFVGINDLPKVEAPDEDGATFFENAAIKARFYSQHFGEIALADDSGLVVDALGGAPGVHSARYGGDGLSDLDRLRLLLANLRDVPAEERTARFECVVVVAGPERGGDILHAVGAVEGKIITEPRGSNGFGYDPVFVPSGETLTTAEMSADEKDALSHRGLAVRAIAPRLSEFISNL